MREGGGADAYSTTIAQIASYYHPLFFLMYSKLRRMGISQSHFEEDMTFLIQN
jgi:hypothetical protein